MLRWFLRRGFWDFITLAKFVGAKPVDIPKPTAKSGDINPKPMREAIPDVPLYKVMACSPADIPEDERSWHGIVYRVQVWLYKLYSPMQPGLPRIDPDPQVALKRAFNGLRRILFHDPNYRPSIWAARTSARWQCAVPTPATQTLAPMAIWEWDLTMLEKYEHHPGLINIGSRVLFREDPARRSLQADSIECALSKGKRPITPTDPEWDQACKIALCAASTHLSLVRHFNWVHLAGGAQLAIATRNSLPKDHPLFRLLWPYIFGTQQSNDMVTRGQMARGGDFETTFSFTFKGMCDLFDDTYQQYRAQRQRPCDGR